MTTDLPCLRSVEAFLAAPPAELAAAVLVCGFADRLDEPHPRIEVLTATGAVAAALGISHERPGTRPWMQAMNTPAHAEVPFAVGEGVLFAEQRLCLLRVSGDMSEQYLTLLRRGHDALRSGEPGRYLG